MALRPSVLLAGALLWVGAGLATVPVQAQTPASGVADDTVLKAGVATHHVLAIRHDYSQRIQAAAMPAEKQGLAQQAQTETVKAVTDQGLTVQQYDQVLHRAADDPNLRAQLLKVASQAR